MTTGAPPIRAEQLFARAAERYPDRVALLYGTNTWTYAEIDVEVRRRGWRLRSAGLPPGATVVAIEPMSDDLLFAWLACCHLGLIFCHLSTQYTAREIVPLATRAAAQLVLTRAGTPHPHLPMLTTLPLNLPDADEPRGAFPPIGSAEDTMLLATTSGTTASLPKLAIMPHRALTWRYATPAGNEKRPGVTAMTTQSFAGLTRQCCAIVGQGFSFLIASTLVPARLEHELARAQTTFLLTQPAILGRLIDNPRPLPDTLHLAAIRVGAAALPIATAQAATRRYGAPVYQAYGATEAGTLAIQPERGAASGTIGHPVPGVTIRLVDPEGNDVPAGVQGELIVQSPGVMGGYLGDPAATAAALRDGWFWTGDLAVQNAHGHYSLQGRRSLLINVGGLKVAPEEVEAALLTHPAVREVVVVGRPDERRGERLCAIICPAGTAPATAELRRFCLERLAPHKVPQTWEFRESLPRSPLGKLLRQQL